jgi:hypothetical protein
MAAKSREIEKFPNDLDVTFVSDNQFRLHTEFIYKSDHFGDIMVPINYKTDGASIPRFIQPFIGSPWAGRYPKATVIHDWLCSSSGLVFGRDDKLTKKQSDLVFLEAMEYLGVGYIRRSLMYRAVRIYEREYEWEKKLVEEAVEQGEDSEKDTDGDKDES